MIMIRIRIKQRQSSSYPSIAVVIILWFSFVACQTNFFSDTFARSLTYFRGLERTDYSSANFKKSVAGLYDEFASCMLGLEKEFFQKQIPRCWDSGIPCPFSVKILNDRYYILSTLAGIPTRDSTNNRTHHLAYRSAKSYACNGELAQQMETQRTGIEYLFIECPATMKPSETKLETLRIELREEQDIGPGQTRNIEYNVETLLECEKIDIKLSSAIVQKDNPKIGITATFGAPGDRETVLEWVTYHQLLGFEHIWLYVNEPWLNGTDLPTHLDGVTFIPYDNKIGNHWNNFTFQGKLRDNHMEVFRMASQNDALFRAKRMNLDWMAFIDLDEIIVLEDHAYSSNPDVKKYMEIWNQTHAQNHSGIWLMSLPFGLNPDQPKPEPNYLLSSTWKYKGDPEDYILKYERPKIVVNVHQVTAVKCHWIAGGKEEMFYAPFRDIRINHYKKRERGVFNQKHGYHTSSETEEDTKLRDEMQEAVVKQMEINIRTSR